MRFSALSGGACNGVELAWSEEVLHWLSDLMDLIGVDFALCMETVFGVFICGWSERFSR